MPIDETRRQNVARAVRDLGVRWHRSSLLWEDVVTDDNGTPAYDWSGPDDVFETLLSNSYGNLNLMITLRCVHETYASGSVSGGVSAPPDVENIEKYKEFVRKAVQRYNGDGIDDADFVTPNECIKSWQIENEPGICATPPEGYLNSRYWNQDFPYSDLGSLFITAHTEIRQIDPDATVLLPGFTYRALNQRTLTKASGYNGEDNYDDCGSFPEELLGWLNDNGGDFDVFDAHFYKQYGKARDNVGAGDTAARLGDNIAWHLELHPQFADKPVWIAETSYMTEQAEYYSNDTEAHFNAWVAQDTMKRFFCLFGNRTQTSKIFYWFAADPRNAPDWSTPVPTNAFESYYRGLFDKGVKVKPCRYSLKQLIDKTYGKIGCTCEEDGLSPVPKRFIYRLDSGDTSLYVLWREGSPQKYAIAFDEFPAGSNIKITYLDTDGSPTVDTSKYLDGAKTVTLKLKRSPIYIELN
jgi:hypothetical protein